MPMNYLQYIRQTAPSITNVRFLVSGMDGRVRQAIGQHIVSSCWERGKTMFIMDNTQKATDFSSGIGGYHMVDILEGTINLCENLLEVNSIKGISRLRSCLSALGFDDARSMKVVAYLSFVRETENRLGNALPLSISVLEQYSGVALVKWKLEQLVGSGKLHQVNYEYLLGKYAEVSSAAADFETFLILFAPFLGTILPTREMAIHLPIGEFATDKPMQQLMCKLMVSYIRENPESSAILILDDGKGERKCLADTLKCLPVTTEIHMFSDDVFSLDNADLGILMNTFPVRIYSRHEDMTSCGKIEQQCGQIDVVKNASSVSIDRRFRMNSAWDMLLGTNRTDTEIRSAPSKESRFRKELINSMFPGTAILDCGGSQVLLSF